jgi:hypothetical protein
MQAINMNKVDAISIQWSLQIHIRIAWKKFDKLARVEMVWLAMLNV